MNSALSAASPMIQRGGPTDPAHDEQLRRGIIMTDVSRPVAWLVTLLFLSAIYAIPLSQAYLEKREGEDSPLVDLFERAPTAENLRQDKGIEEASYAKAWVQPRAQLWLTRLGRVGNRLAVIGRDGWLYFTPGVLHVGGPGFLDRTTQLIREREALDAGQEAIHADPVAAILAFQRALAKRGARLVLLPMPDKAALEPEPLAGRRGLNLVQAQNVDYERFLERLRNSGVAVFDARQSIPKHRDQPLYLVQDTHFAPPFMELIARDLAQMVASLGLPKVTDAPELHTVEQPAARVGDLVDMLKLPEEQQFFQPQSVLVHQVQDESGEAWESDPNADVLLLGDSFTNIFSLEGMGWGSSAGLAPHLALALNRPIDVIAQNDSGAFATRQALSRELMAGLDRLAGKRVVIWEFASRELSAGDWKLLDFPTPPAAETK
jgi:hypothetical protein